MAMGAQRARDLAGVPDGPAWVGARRKLEGADLRQAEAWRAQGRGWQTIARCLAVNEIDLRRAMGDPAVAEASGAPGPATPPPPTGRLGVLAAVAEGATSRRRIAEAIGSDREEVGKLIAALKQRGFLYGNLRRGGLALTARGEAHLKQQLAVRARLLTDA